MHKAMIALTGVLLSGAVAAQTPPQPLRPEQATWFSPPAVPALKAAWLVGSEQGAGPYLLRVRLAAGGRFPPHTHPDTRYTTVLSGTLYVGFGERVDENAVVAVPAGAIYEAPAGEPHWVWAKDGDVEYQESGVAPTATRPLR
ncbi:cupin domain-containing protein [Methyloversatilis sp. MC4-4]|uniref:cupin domain-containing protein n=1 Tax=Methyloversatilis sp. MC4-4 TaxID=3132824 RepID=UPI003CF16636